MTKSYVAYYRVSTQRRGKSGLNLEAQEAAVLRHVNGHGVLLAAYREIESGRKKTRPELAKAIAHAKRSKATLVCAGRLATTRFAYIPRAVPAELG